MEIDQSQDAYLTGRHRSNTRGSVFTNTKGKSHVVWARSLAGNYDHLWQFPSQHCSCQSVDHLLIQYVRSHTIGGDIYIFIYICFFLLSFLFFCLSLIIFFLSFFLFCRFSFFTMVETPGGDPQMVWWVTLLIYLSWIHAFINIHLSFQVFILFHNFSSFVCLFCFVFSYISIGLLSCWLNRIFCQIISFFHSLFSSDHLFVPS